MKKFIKYTSIFLSGAAVGATVAYMVTKTKAELDAAKQIEEAREAYAQKMADAEELLMRAEQQAKLEEKVSTCKDGVCNIIYDEIGINELDSIKEIQADVPIQEVIDTKPKTKAKRKAKVKQEVNDAVEELKEVTNNYISDNPETLEVKVEPSNPEEVEREYPYEIFATQFDQKLHYDKRTVFFYTKDEIMVDGDNNVMDVDYSTVGDDYGLCWAEGVYNLYTEPERIEDIDFPTDDIIDKNEVFFGIIYIRNDRFQVDYEIVCIDMYYDDVNAMDQQAYEDELEANGYVDEDGNVSYLEDAPEEEAEEDDEV